MPYLDDFNWVHFQRQLKGLQGQRLSQLSCELPRPLFLLWNDESIVLVGLLTLSGLASAGSNRPKKAAATKQVTTASFTFADEKDLFRDEETLILSGSLTPQEPPPGTCTAYHLQGI